MKKNIFMTIAGLMLVAQTSAVDPVNPNPVIPKAITSPMEVLKDDYAKYGEKLGTTFKGTEDLNFLKEVVSWLGTPYKYGSSNKGKGTDCSGFVSGVYKNAYDIKLNRTSSSMVLNVNKVDKSELECGDLLFFANEKGSIYHVAIYLANNVFVHSATSKNVGVKTNNLNETYYKKNYYSAGRVKSLDNRGVVADNTVKHNVVNGDKQKESDKKEITKKESVEDLYSKYSRSMGVKFKGNEDLAILKEIDSWLGTPYKSGASTKQVGTDSPGLVCGVFDNACEVQLTRSPEKMMKNLKKTSKKKLKFADVVFYKKDKAYPIIGIYLGDGKIVYTSVSKGVMVIDMATVKFNLDFMGSVPALNY